MDQYRSELARKQARRRRLLGTLALTLLMVAGFASADAPSFGAGRAPSATDATGSAASCGSGRAAVSGAHLTYAGDSVTATFTVDATCPSLDVTLASYQMLASPQPYPQTRFDTTTISLGPGVHSLTITLPHCYWQADLATGPSLPAIDANHLYGGRLVISAVGGASTCSTTTTTTTPTTPTTTSTTSTTGTTGTTTTGTTTTGTTTTGTTTTGTTTTGTTTTGTTTTTTTPMTTTTTTTGSTTTSVPPPAVATTDISVTKAADRTNAVVGGQVGYLLTVTNNGSVDALDVVLVDSLPPEESLVSISDPACAGTTVITCNFGTLAAGASRAVTIVTLARSPGTATNIATVTTTTPETTTSNNQAQTSVPIAGAFVPPRPHSVCATVELHHRASLVVGGAATIAVVARRSGKPAVVRVEVHGAGVSVVTRTNASGSANVTVTPSRVGVLRAHVLGAATCPRSTEVPVAGAFRPPQLTG